LSAQSTQPETTVTSAPRVRSTRALSGLERGAARAGLWALEAVSRPVAPRNQHRKGIALLMVIGYIAVMSAMVISSFYNSQVSFSISSNVRDDLKAYYKARSAMNLGRLIIAYQYELENDEFFGPRLRKSNFQMYQIVDMLMEPFKTGAVMVDVPGESAIAHYDLSGAGATGLGNESGDFTVRVVPEEGRININRFQTGLDQVALFDLCMLVAPPQYDDLFNTSSKDANRDERTEVIGALVDWVDGDSDRTRINTACMLEGTSGDEDGRYNAGDRKYQTKNAKFTTLDELYLVHGIGDDFMETFADSLTVYPVDRINVNLATARVMYAVLCNAVNAEDFENQVWACSDPRISTPVLFLAMALEGYQQFVLNPINLLNLYTVQGELSVIPGVTPNGSVVPFRNQREFRGVLQALQSDPLLLQRFLAFSSTAFLMLGEELLTVDPSLLGTGIIQFDDSKLYSSITTASPKIFRFMAAGEYNGTRKTLTAVVDFNTTGGQFLYWREY